VGGTIKDYVIAEPSRLIDPAAWDKSDLFIVWQLPGYRFASSRLANILRQEKVSGVHLIPAPRIPVEKGAEVGPASIMYCMPEDRARELGQRFGISGWRRFHATGRTQGSDRAWHSALPKGCQRERREGKAAQAANRGLCQPNRLRSLGIRTLSCVRFSRRLWP
jgi:hypothetical protein